MKKSSTCFVKQNTKLYSLLLSIFSILLLSSCGGPPEQADENSEGPAVLAFTSSAEPNFGEALIGFTYQRTFEISNASLTVPATNITVTSNLDSGFSFSGGSFPGSGGTCGVELAAGSTCTFVIDLIPTVSGALSSRLSLSYYDGLEDQSADFDFSAQARSPIPASLAISPSDDHDFGIIAIGGFDEVDYTVTNTGEIDASGVVFSGLAAPFTLINNTCPATVAPGANCSFTLRFTPVAQVTSNSALNIDYNDGVAAQSFVKNFSGEGRVAGFIAIDEGTTFDFGIINNGFFINQILTVRNTGGGTASAVSFSGVSAPFSLQSNACPAT
ncbi:MAG: choice-of-anchor D domain-containing protein, partial [Bdellovibrionales bacterium]|nr:choice-of-anchor D domain-containing protein [Bdellovibrionales bacterium]NQZ18492.1 choice-of-anchor D domain-containing protein [Bdellovibrionales bacterium]